MQMPPCAYMMLLTESHVYAHGSSYRAVLPMVTFAGKEAARVQLFMLKRTSQQYFADGPMRTSNCLATASVFT